MEQHKCNYTDCRQPTDKTFAQVPLCEEHFWLIWNETIKYYRPKGRYVDYFARHHFHKISHLIPWSTIQKGRA